MITPIRLIVLTAMLSFLSGVGATNAAAADIDVSQQPLFTTTSQPPLNMLVMGKDHKIYYEAYNDASDLNGDGALDIGYKPDSITYYGYFNSDACYTWDGDKFVPAAAATHKQCSGQWSGDFLNYLTTSRMDALRRVLYGGWRQTDSTTQTILQGAYFPQDGHSWGKEYQSVARDGYDISKYSPLSIPATDKYHLFAVTTVTGNNNTYPGYQAPLFRVLKNTDKRVWNWLSIEGPVAGNKCFTATNARVDCVTSGTTTPFPGHPTNRGGFDTMESTYAIPADAYGTGSLNTINCNSSDCNPYGVDDNYLSIIAGTLRTSTAGFYQFRVDGDDSIDFQLSLNGGPVATAGCYGPRGFGACSGAEKSAVVSLSSNTNYLFKFRQEEAAGGDGYKLEWRTCSNSSEASCGNSWSVVPNSNTNGINGTTIATYNLTPLSGAVTRDDYLVRVQSCPSGTANASLRESICKKYPNDQYKPTGILHDYGENTRMYFGLITGSQFNNLEGGVLRRNVSNFGDEIDAATGQFKTDVNGIANTISSLRMIGGGYDGGTTNNLTSDKNWNWGNGTGNCPAPDISVPLANGKCRMWGNPVAEMLYESLRYFAGAAAPTTRFATGGASQGTAEETTMGLHVDTWKDPYTPIASGGGGFLSCAKPYQTIISDINPSYDGDLPDSAFAGAVTTTNNTPATISGFNASAEGQTIWDAEFGGPRQVFIGETAGVTDGAPTAKTATSFGDIRGLSPEEPTKGGSYYTASVARFARVTDINAASGLQNLSTYSIALASPLPRIEFPIGGGKITLVPFAKTASGTFGTGTRKPTNTIVDFYVEKIVNLPGQPVDMSPTGNNGLPYAVFRINYEDVEQGNDHDMDAIVRYLISANVDGTVTVTLNSEYAAGSADQNMGYVMSGTTQDGVYLDVRDSDSGAGTYLPYLLNTPNPLLPGACGATTPPALCNQQLPLTSTRTFTPTAEGAGAGAIFLNDPLWYAAKYGAPDPDHDDIDGDGVPDNYFLVTNPANLKTQLDKAFADIIAQSQPTASVATSTPRFVNGVTLAYEASFNATDWTGDLKAYKIRSDGVYTGTRPVWKASEELPAAASRNIFTSKPQTAAFTGLGIDFTKTGLPAAMQTTLMAGLDSTLYNIDDVVAYLRGDQTKEQSQIPPGPYRTRSSRLGDVLNSSPAVNAVTSYGYGQLLMDVAPAAAAAYPAFVEAKKGIYGANSENPVVFYGSNDGMLHAIDASEGSNGGKELFAYVPNAAIDKLNELVKPGYTHRYYVDGSPTISDAYLGQWKTLLLASTGAGSRSVFALDVTNPSGFSTSKVMWEFNSNSADADAHLLGQDIGRPWMGLADDGNWVATFGNGYNSDGSNAVLFIRDLANGTKIATIPVPVPTSCTATPGGDGCGPNGLATAVLVDNDSSGAGDTIYAGDYLGNLWRFEYDGSSWTLGNGNQPLFVARDADGKRQSITSGVYTVANPLGGTMVIFGSGRYLDVNDADQAQVGLGSRAAMDTIYGVLDSRSCTNAGSDHKCTTWSATGIVDGRADLQQQSITGYTPQASDGTGGFRTASRNGVNYRTGGGDKMGWFLDLSFVQGSGASAVDLMAGERVVVRPDGILSDVVVNTIRPQGNSCEPGVQNATMVLDALTGAADYIPIPPPGGYPVGTAPPPGLVGTDTYRGPPQGEPPILIIRPPNPGVPCMPTGLPGDTCDPTAPPPADTPTSCSWRSPNSTSSPPGKPMPCGRISWRQLR